MANRACPPQQDGLERVVKRPAQVIEPQQLVLGPQPHPRQPAPHIQPVAPLAKHRQLQRVCPLPHPGHRQQLQCRRQRRRAGPAILRLGLENRAAVQRKANMRVVKRHIEVKLRVPPFERHREAQLVSARGGVAHGGGPGIGQGSQGRGLTRLMQRGHVQHQCRLRALEIGMHIHPHQQRQHRQGNRHPPSQPKAQRDQGINPC